MFEAPKKTHQEIPQDTVVTSARTISSNPTTAASYPSTNPILVAYNLELQATPESVFCFFQPLEKSKMHAQYIVQMRNQTEPNRFTWYLTTNRTEP